MTERVSPSLRAPRQGILPFVIRHGNGEEVTTHAGLPLVVKANPAALRPAPHVRNADAREGCATPLRQCPAGALKPSHDPPALRSLDSE